MRKRCWQKPSQLTDERSGFVSSARKQAFGRDGAAADATPTFRQDHKGSTDRQCRRKPVEFHQVPHPLVLEKENSPETRKQKTEICERRLISSCGSSKWKKGRQCKANVQKEKVVSMRTGRWRLTKKFKERRCWMGKEKRLQKQIREIEKFTDVDPLFQEDTGKSGRKNCMRLSRNGRISCRSIRKMQEMSQKLQSLQDKKKKCLKDAWHG